MRIGIDASRAFLRQRTGTEEYSHELIRHLAEMRCDHQFFVYLKKGMKIDFELPSNFFTKEIGGDFLWTQFHLSLELLRNKVDVLFVPSHSVPLIHPKRTVATIHGLEYRHCPACYSKKDRTLMEINTAATLLFADRIIVPSLSSKRDLMEDYGISSRRISLIRHGIGKIAGNARNMKTDGFNILFVGRLEKRKNVVGIVRAFDAFVTKTESAGRAHGKDIKLILAGKKGFGYAEIEDAILGSPHKDDILLPGYVTEERKRELFGEANIFIFPSLYEGFGLPVWEAMSHGIPVICSANSSLGEIATGAALLIDPLDTEKISAAMATLYENEEERHRLVESGYEKIRNADWKKCAEETMEILTRWE